MRLEIDRITVSDFGFFYKRPGRVGDQPEKGNRAVVPAARRGWASGWAIWTHRVGSDVQEALQVHGLRSS